MTCKASLHNGMARNTFTTSCIQHRLLLLLLLLQAYDPLAENPSGGHYIGARLPADLAPKIDALNVHIYSFFNNATGSRVGVHPEHPGSSMNGAAG